MSAVDFEYLLNRIGPHIKKSDTVMRKSIPVNERLAVTLRFLASGDSFISLSYLFKMSNQVISDIVHEVCMPQTVEEWTNLSNEYNNKWNFPNCIGALDGKHVILSSPIHSGSEFINYKGTFSIVMMALVDAEYCFYVDIGCQGQISDGDVFRNTSLFKKLEGGNLNVPLPHPISLNGPPVPYPYPGTHKKGSKERHFNYRLSRARRFVENVFGIMSSIFRVLRKPMLLNPQKATNIVMACSLLHNFLRKSRTSSSRYTPPGTFDSDNDGRIIPGT
nr:unnamed protein product [Callosobruchus analis]